MDIFCTARFQKEFDKLMRKRSYRTLEAEVIGYFFGKEARELSNGTRLNQSDTEPYIKKRLNGRGGFRIYFLLLIKNDRLYLMFVHPKTGSDGAENITDESKAAIYKEVLAAINTGATIKLTLSPDKSSIVFTPRGAS